MATYIPHDFDRQYQDNHDRSYFEEFFPNKNILVIEDEILNHPYNIDSIILQIPELDIVIIDLSLNPFPITTARDCLDQMIDITSKHARTVVLINDFTKLDDPSRIYFPALLWSFSKKQAVFWNKKSFRRKKFIFDIESNKIKNICCLNRSLHWHRILLFNQICQRGWIDKISCTFGKREDELVMWSDCTQHELDVFSNYQHLLPVTILDQDNVEPDDITISHPVYAECAFNLVCESTADDRGFVSEKTAKPFMALQIPIMFGPTGINKYCSQIGLDMFDDIIPWQTWDHIDDGRTRLDLIMQFLDQFLEQDLLEIYNKNLHRVMRNKQYFHSEQFRDVILKNIRNIDQ